MSNRTIILDRLANRGFAVTLSHEPANNMPWLLVLKRLASDEQDTVRSQKFSRRYMTASAALLAAATQAAEMESPQRVEVKEPPPPACPTGKRRIPTEEDAEDLVTSLTRKNLRLNRPTDHTAARAYQCHLCNDWHLTSQPFGPNRRPAASPR